MQDTNKEVPSGYAARLLLKVVGTGIGREESRTVLASICSSLLHLHPGVLPFQGDASQAWGYFCSGWIVSISGTYLGVGFIV